MTDAVIYLDSSAILKLVFEEDESDSLRGFLADHPLRATSIFARIEVLRTAGRVADRLVLRDAHALMTGLRLLRLDDTLMTAAIEIPPRTLRTFDAVHLVSALSLRPDLTGIISYDRALAQAAESAGLTVFAPA